MRNFLSIILAIFVFIFAGVDNAYPKEQDEFSYIKMPIGKYYKFPREKESLGVETINCIAYSKFPDAYYNIRPWYCAGYTAAAALHDLTSSTAGKTPAKLILLPSGLDAANSGGLQGEDLLCKIKNDFPDAFKEYKEYFNVETTCNPFSVDLNAAASDALATTALRFAIAVGVFFLITIGLLRKPRDTALKKGRWCAAIGAAVAVAIVSQGRRSFDDYLFILSINVVIYSGIGCLIGLIWGKVMERPKPLSDEEIQQDHSQLSAPQQDAKPSVTRESDRDYWSEALTELDTGTRDELLWAKCVVEADGDLIRAKAAYLAKRVSDMNRKTGNP